MNLLVRDKIHGPAHVIVGPTHIEPVFHGPRCHVMGRAETFEKMMGPGPGIFENVMDWAGPRPIL